jgi:methyl coenzyme M reductase subunit D
MNIIFPNRILGTDTTDILTNDLNNFGNIKKMVILRQRLPPANANHIDMITHVRGEKNDLPVKNQRILLEIVELETITKKEVI